MIDEATKKKLNARGRRNILRGISEGLFYSLLGVPVALLLVMAFFLFGHRLYDRDFDSELWRTDENERYTMIPDLKSKLKDSDYSSAELVKMLGDPGGEPPYHEMMWSLGECTQESGVPTSYCYCWLKLTIVEDRLDEARIHCS